MRAILILLVVAITAMASPTIFGPAGVPTVWDFGIVSFKSDTVEASVFTSPLATSYLSMVGDSLVFTSNLTAGDNNMWVKFVNSRDEVYILTIDDSENWLTFPTSAFGALKTPDDGGMVVVFDRAVSATPSAGVEQGELFRTDAVDVLGVGALADGSGSVEKPFLAIYGGIYSRIIEVTADYTATLGDNTITVTDTLNITLPSLADAYGSDMGLNLFIKLEADAPCTVFCAGSDSLDASVELVLARWDCLQIQAGPNRWVTK